MKTDRATRAIVNLARRGSWFLLTPLAIYVVWWSYVTIARFYAGSATIYDLGLEMQGLWWPLHPQGLSWSTYLLEVASRPDNLLFSPLALPGSYPLLLVFQTVALSLGALAVFDIARRVWGDRIPAFLLALVYLLYFPMAGVNWFDFHLQALFIPGFLFGYALLLRKHYRLSFAVLFLAGATTFGYMVLIIGFTGLTLVELFVRQRWYGRAPDRRERTFLVTLFLASTPYFLFQYLYFSTYLGGTSYLFSGANYFVATGGIPWANRALVLVLLAAPVLFLVLLAPKWLAMLTPFAVLVLDSLSPAYSFPTIFQIQFVTMAIPMVFIGTVYGVRRLVDVARRAPAPVADPPRRAPTRWGRAARDRVTAPRVVGVMLVATVLFATVFQPYGPFNADTGSGFRLGSSTAVNWTTYSEIQHLVNLVPRDTPWVLVQNNIPAVLPRPLAYHETPLTPSFLDWENVTTYDALTDQFPLYFYGATYQVPIQYVIADPSSPWYEVGGVMPATSMENFLVAMWASKAYGILGEADGMVVLERGYTGPPQYYVPSSVTYPAQDLCILSLRGPSGAPVITASNLSEATVWYGPYVTLLPGMYQVTFSMMVANDSPLNRLNLFVSANAFQEILGESEVTGGNFTAVGEWTQVTDTGLNGLTPVEEDSTVFAGPP